MTSPWRGDCTLICSTDTGKPSARAPVRRRLAGPTPKCARETAAGGKPEQIRDLADAVMRRAEVNQGQRVTSLVEDLPVGRAALAELSLQRARAHAKVFGNLVLRRLGALQSLHQHLANARLNVVALDASQVLERDRIRAQRQVGVGAVERRLDADAVEHQPVLRGAE